MFLFPFVFLSDANWHDSEKPADANTAPALETESATTPESITKSGPAIPDVAPVEGGNEHTSIQFTGNAEDYAEMPGSYGKSRNTFGYTISGAKDVTYENFLKLEIGMSFPDVRGILSDAMVESTEYSFYTEWTFESDSTLICATIRDDQLIDAQYHDYFRVCVNPSEVSMDKFRQLEPGMLSDEVKGILGEGFYINSISSIFRGDATRLTWFNDEGEIIVVFNDSNRVTSFEQSGFQYIPDSRMDYDVLTNQQLLDNFAKVRMGIEYAELEELMGNYIPLFSSRVDKTYVSVEDLYKFQRGDGDDMIAIDFYFNDGKLYQADFWIIQKTLLPMTDASSAEKLKEGMTYSEVAEILGEGKKNRAEVCSLGIHKESYMWDLPGRYNYVQVAFTDGIIENDGAIYIYNKYYSNN